MKHLAKKLVQVVGSVSGKVGKSGYNSHQKYHYVMEADILEAMRPELVKAGVAITTSVSDVKKEGNLTTVTLEHTIIDSESGEFLVLKSVGQGQDNGDKGVFKAITGANKYFLLKMFQLAGDDDPENEGGNKAPQNQPPKQNFQSKPAVAVNPAPVAQKPAGFAPKPAMAPSAPKPNLTAPKPPAPKAKATEPDFEPPANLDDIPF